MAERRGAQRAEEQELGNEMIDLCRVAKATKGAKNLSFRATVIVGDRAGKVGLGKGNTREIPQAVQQGIRDAQRHMIKIPILNGTIPHPVIGKFKASKVILKPAYPGTGIIAGRTVGAICRLAGIKDILTKALGSTNPLTLAKATFEGLKQLRTTQEIAQLRDKRSEEILE